MPCSDTSSSICLRLDKNERFDSFNYAKITCGREISSDTGLNDYLKKKTLDDILKIPYEEIRLHLPQDDEEAAFILYLEWDALRSAIAQYLGINDDRLDRERAQISAIAEDTTGVSIDLVILPPKELPKITPCSLLEKEDSQSPVE